MPIEIHITGETCDDVATQLRAMLELMDGAENEVDDSPAEAPPTAEVKKPAKKKASKKASKKKASKKASKKAAKKREYPVDDGEGTPQSGKNVGPNAEPDEDSDLFDSDDDVADLDDDAFQPPKEITADDLRTVATAVVKAGHKDELVAIVRTFETEDGEVATSLKAVQEDDYRQLYVACLKQIDGRDPAEVIATAVAG